ncbi:MAG: phosphodiester glycosidase family protein [Bacteroidales bacterium]|nr:phosphodiester glycosidase family protein [Bacteroidales bacterium]
MKRVTSLLVVLFICAGLCKALCFTPNRDSLAIVDGRWEQDTVFWGVVFKQIRFEQNEFFASNQCLHLIEIAPDAAVTFALAAEPLLTTTGALAQKHEAIAAINGSFFRFNYTYNTDDYNSVDYLRINRERLADNTYTATGQRQMHQEAAVAILKGQLYIVKATTEKGWEDYIYSEDVLSSGPLLAIAGRIEPLKETSFYTTRHPRTAVAKKPDGTVMLLVVDGRNPAAQGMSLQELQQTLLWLGACDIINFDGGGSSTMYVQGKGADGVVNHPCDNQQFDHLGSRRVANALCVLPAMASSQSSAQISPSK